MKYYICFIGIQLIFAISSESSSYLKRFSNSPIGPYRLVIKQIFNCNPTKNNNIQHNMYVSHRANSTLLLGNSTLEIPFDDTLFLEIRMSLKDSLGNWKENLYWHKTPHACSSLKQLMGNAWIAFINGAGSQNIDCPILPGIYVSTGIDTSLFENANFPKTFFYGTYKFYMYYTRKNDIFGCQVLILELKRT